MAIATQLTNAKAGLTSLQSRLTSGSTDLSNDPSDPDLQMLSGLKEKLSTAEAETAAAKGPWRQQPEDAGATGEYGDPSQADERRDR